MGGGVAAVVLESEVSGLLEALAAGFTDGVAAAVVFVVGGDVADAGVQAHGIVLGPDRAVDARKCLSRLGF